MDKNTHGGANRNQGAKPKNKETGKRVKCSITLDSKFYEKTINHPFGSRSDIVNQLFELYFETIKPSKDTEG